MPELTWFEILVVCFIYVPWGVTVSWWYASLVYFLFIHKEDQSATEDFSIKILTTGDDVKVISKTARFCKKDPLIISRKPIELSRGQVKVMPEDFQCAAQYKAQQLEWARMAYPSEFTLYLDEDSLCDVERIPDADIVQFQEVPTTNSLLIGSIEAYRIGFQLEQALFEKFPPLFLWGGGVAIKQQLEDEITWDRSGITEDTAFIFSIRRPYTFKYSKHQIKAEAPLTVKDLIKQRWRWASGTYQDIRYLRFGLRKTFVYFRIIQWSLWPLYVYVIPIFLSLPIWFPIFITFQSMVWSFAGTRIMKLPWHKTAIAVLLTPIASFIHSIGATLALVKPQKKFSRTPKQNPSTTSIGGVTSRRPQKTL